MVEICYCIAVCNTEKLQKLHDIGSLTCTIPVTITFSYEHFWVDLRLTTKTSDVITTLSKLARQLSS